MATDIALIRTILLVLAVVGDRGLSLHALASDVENRSERSRTVQEVEAALSICQQKGWLRKACNDLNQEKWFITEAGRHREAQF